MFSPGSRIRRQSPDMVMNMIYRAPLIVDIEGFEAYIPECPELKFEGRTLPEDLPVVPQFEVLYLVINVNEDYIKPLSKFFKMRARRR